MTGATYLGKLILPSTALAPQRQQCPSDASHDGHLHHQPSIFKAQVAGFVWGSDKPAENRLKHRTQGTCVMEYDGLEHLSVCHAVGAIELCGSSPSACFDSTHRFLQVRQIRETNALYVDRQRPREEEEGCVWALLVLFSRSFRGHIGCVPWLVRVLDI